MKYAKRARSAGAARRVSSAVVQKKKRTSKVSALRLNPVVAKLVDRRIQKPKEVHFRQGVVADATGVSGRIRAAGTPTVNTNAGSWPELIPVIPVGDSSADREGNQLTLRSMVLDLNIRTSVREPMYVRVIVASSKQFKSQENTRSNSILTPMCDGLINNNGNAAPFGGVMQFLHSPVNREDHIVHFDRVMLINVDHLTTQGTDWAVNTRWFTRTIQIHLKVKGKVLRYSNATDLIPNNFAPVLYVGTVDPNSPLTESGKAVSVFCTSRVRFNP